MLRDTLDRVEVTSIAMIMGFVYLGFSAYLIQPDDIAPVLLALIGCLFMVSIKCNINIIKLLQIRFFNLQQANVRTMLPDLAKKIRILKLFLLFSYVFYLNDIIKITFECIGLTAKIDSGPYWNYLITVEQVFVTTTCFCIFILYRSKTNNEYNPSIIIPYASQIVAPILSATIYDSDVLANDNPALMVCPHNSEIGKFYLDFFNLLMVATPLK